MQNDANACKSMQGYAVNGNINENKNGNENTYSRYAKKEQKTRYGNFDPKEAFKKAFERSYPGEDIDKIVEEYYST